MAKRHNKHSDAPDLNFPGRVVPGHLNNDQLTEDDLKWRRRQEELDDRHAEPHVEPTTKRD